MAAPPRQSNFDRFPSLNWIHTIQYCIGTYICIPLTYLAPIPKPCAFTNSHMPDTTEPATCALRPHGRACRHVSEIGILTAARGDTGPTRYRPVGARPAVATRVRARVGARPAVGTRARAVGASRLYVTSEEHMNTLGRILRGYLQLSPSCMRDLPQLCVRTG